jgi:signal peptidase I
VRTLAAICGLTFIGWIFLAPSSLAGSMEYLVVHGTSMEPSVSRGDVVVTRAQSDYGVGDIVAYGSDLGVIILHRIIAREGDRYVLKGDNNAFVDRFTPHHSEVVGRAVATIPAGGRAFSVMSSGPMLFGSFALAGILLGLPKITGHRRPRGDRIGAGRRNR